MQSDFTVHSGYKFFCQYVCSLGIEPIAFSAAKACSTIEPQEPTTEPQLRTGLDYSYQELIDIEHWGVLYLNGPVLS